MPFAAVKGFEAALPSASQEDRWFLCALLVMIWASLRWSDLQRLDLSSVVATQDLLCNPLSGRAGSGPAALVCRWAPMAQTMAGTFV